MRPTNSSTKMGCPKIRVITAYVERRPIITKAARHETVSSRSMESVSSVLRQGRVYESSFLALSFLSSSGWRSHFRGMFWLVPSGRARRILIGRTPSSSSRSAMSIGDSAGSLISSRTGAPMETWSALAPTTLALSKRVSFGGPISMLSGSLELTCSLFATFFLFLWRTRAWSFP